MALSYWPTSMQRAALLLSFCERMFREFMGGDSDGVDRGMAAGAGAVDVVD